MTEKKTPIHVVDDPPPDSAISPEVEAGLDEDELEFRRMRCDLPGVAGAAAQGIVAITVDKAPETNEFFRTSPDFRPKTKLVNIEVGMDKQFFAVDPCMEIPLTGIGISFTESTLYMVVTPKGAVRIIPIPCGSDNEYNCTKEMGLLDGVKQWVRIYHDKVNKKYKVFPAPVGRFDEPQWPALSGAKIFRLCFRDKGRLIDSTEHELFKKWAARDK